MTRFVSKLRLEFFRYTNIIKKMFQASGTSSELSKAELSLGRLACEAIERGDLSWNDPKAQELAQTIMHLKKNLETMETEVKNIKLSPSGN